MVWGHCQRTGLRVQWRLEYEWALSTNHLSFALRCLELGPGSCFPSALETQGLIRYFAIGYGYGYESAVLGLSLVGQGLV